MPPKCQICHHALSGLSEATQMDVEVEAEDEVENAEVDTKVEHVMSRAFRNDFKQSYAATNGVDEPPRVPADSTIKQWFYQSFGSKCGRNYTSIYPHKSDWCAMCATYERQIASLRKCVQRYDGMGGLDDTQKQRRKAAAEKIKAIRSDKERHREISHIERTAYMAERDGQDEIYKQAAMDFNVLMTQLDELNSPAQKRNAIKAFVERYASIKLYIDMDYQADKIVQKFIGIVLWVEREGWRTLKRIFFFLRFFASQQKSKKYKNYFFFTRVLDVCIGIYCF